ncbi:kelch repeat-containing protein [Streptomyces sp. NPDC057011]|uniref:kelch repeat-containing protein n=1 Tax=unclassified Streptomyces TaxID=2593676 RepID=UPI003632D2D5
MRRTPGTDHEKPPPGRSRLRGGLRRLAVAALAPLLALAATSATAQGVWVTVPPLPTPRTAFAGTAAHCPEGLQGACVYAVGGFPERDRFEAYSPRTNTWATLPPLQTPRLSLASASAPCPGGVKGDCVYAIGGALDDDTVVGTNEAFSTESGTWLTLPPMPTARAGLATATAPCAEGLGLRGVCVYAVGGYRTGVVPTVEAYSPATNTWATVAPLPQPRAGLGSSAAPCPPNLGLKGTCVYAIGAGNGIDAPFTRAEVYSPVLNGWTSLPDMPTGRFDGPGVATAPCPEGLSDGCVYVLGGLGSAGTLATAEAYSPAANAWITLPSMPTAHREFAAAHAPCPKTPKRPCVYAVSGFFANGGGINGATQAFAIERAEAAHKPKPKPKPDPFAEAAPGMSADRPQAPAAARAPLPTVTPGQTPAPSPAPTSSPAPAASPGPVAASTPTPRPLPSAVISVGFWPLPAPAAPAASPSGGS